jgi:hypothetical protein
MPAPKTPQPDHTNPATVDEALELIQKETTRGSKAESAASSAVYELVRVMEKHRAIRDGEDNNDTGICIRRRA